MSPGRGASLRLIRTGVAVGGAALLVLPFVGGGLPVVRDAPILVAAVGVSALVLAGTIATRFRTSGAWAALAVAGQAAALQLVRAGTSLGYQHYLLPPRVDALHVTIAVGVLLLQTIAVVTLVARNWAAVRTSLVEGLGGWRLALVAAAFVLTSATLSASVPAYVSELAFAAAVQTVNAATVAAAAALLPGDALDRLNRGVRAIIGGGATARPRPARLLPLGVALWVVGVALLLAFAAYQRHPHLPDEIAYLLHARYLAAGQLSLPAPPVPEAFGLDLMYLDGDRWYSPVPPGWPAILALGVAAGSPWLVNPLLAGASVLLTHQLLRHLYDGPTARLGVLLLAVSPWFLFLSMSVMTHTAVLTAGLLGAVAMARSRQTRAAGWAVLAGAATGLVGLIRPLDAVIVGIVLGLWSLAVRGRRWRFAPAASFILAALAVASTVLAYNHHFTGDPTAFPINEYIAVFHEAGSNALGFGPERGLGWGGFDPFPGHDLLDALINTNLNAFALNVELFGWSAGSLLPAFLLATSSRLRRADVAMLGVVALVVATYGLYWFSGGPDFGARYWSLAMIPCVALTARAAPLVGRLLGRRDAGRRDRASTSPRAPRDSLARGVAAIGLASLAAVATFVPWRAVDKYHHYRGMRPGVQELAEKRDFGSCLVLVRGDYWPDYTSAAVYNPLDLRAQAPVYAWDRGPEVRRRLLATYPDREVWVLEGPSRTGDGYRVVRRLERSEDSR